jgi:hypothetical protein
VALPSLAQLALMTGVHKVAGIDRQVAMARPEFQLDA